MVTVPPQEGHILRLLLFLSFNSLYVSKHFINIFLKDKSGVDLSSIDGKRMELLTSGTMNNISDVTPALSVPGKDSGMTPIVDGAYAADYYGIKYLGNYIVKWSSCCTP